MRAHALPDSRQAAPSVASPSLLLLSCSSHAHDSPSPFLLPSLHPRPAAGQVGLRSPAASLPDRSWLARRYDYEGYLASLLISRPRVRLTAIALRALNVELSRVLDVASSPATVAARFAFWSAAVDSLFATEAALAYEGNPVVRELRSVSPFQETLLFLTERSASPSTRVSKNAIARSRGTT